MSSRNNRLNKPIRLDFHSRGNAPRSPQDVDIF
jgi:hypothetical protein